ncbi:MAG: Gfo/Idh/MocA family oxidoreductase [Candidatus Atribacteria bacterium]|nr:Gfo/Idh/MocA family oxidoreductase [Candidatus Atribacteria bacterium]
MSKVRFALVGAGRAGMVHARNLTGYIPEAELCAIVDVNGEQAKKSADEVGVATYSTSLDEMLSTEKIDAVCIASLTFTHREIVEKAVAAGKHIFSEKPMAQTVLEARRIKDLVEKAGVKYQVGFMRRYDPAIRKAWEMVHEGTIGDLVVIKSTGRGPGLPPSWIWDRTKSGGMLAEVSAHDIDTVLWFAGKKPERIYMEADDFKAPEARQKFPDFYDHYVVTIVFEKGPLSIIDGGCPVGYAYDARMEILGTRGMIRVGETEGHGPVLMTLEKKAVRDNHDAWRNRFREGYLEEMKAFIRCIVKDEKPFPSALDGYHAVEIVEHAHQALDQKKPVLFHGEW